MISVLKFVKQPWGLICIWTVPGILDANVLSYKQIFLFQTISKVAQAAGVTPLRIAQPVMYMDSSHAYFLGTLLEKAPSISKNTITVLRCTIENFTLHHS